jgi:plastocyanin
VVSTAPAATVASTPAVVPIFKNTYTPNAVTVPVGTTVTWLNQDDAPHTVTTTKAPIAFDSGPFDKGKSFSYTFTKPGTYEYYCAAHPDMRASVVVTEAAPAAKPPAKPAITLGAPTPSGKKPGTARTSNAGMASMSPPGQDDGWTPASDPVSGASDPLMKHLQAAHFNRSAAGQVHDIAEFDDWMKSHEYLFRQMLDYEIGRQSTLGQAPGLGTFLQHLDVAHWNRSPGQQVEDIGDFQTWAAAHAALIQAVLASAGGH